MKSCAPFNHGAPGWHRAHRAASRRGFTLLEMCMVLLIIALLLGVSVPALQSAFVEQAVRNDARQLALMVRTAMLQSSEQHRPYVIDLTATKTETTMDLHPLGETPKDADETPASTNDDASPASSASDDVEVSSPIDSSNKLFLPDPDKPRTWLALSSASWLFQPGELCPAPRVKLVRGKAWLEMSFNALTGDVENETAYFP